MRADMFENLRLVETNDGTFTFHSKLYDESYHSLNGALNESFVKFCTPCRIGALSESGSVRILDVGFGLGYNVLAAILTARQKNPECTVDIVSLEKHLIPVKTLEHLSLIKEHAKYFDIIKRAVLDLSYDNDGVRITILPGDARRAVKMVEGEFDAVFHDPFSVKKNVELWTVDFFRELRKMMSDDAVLATYSASTPVRCALIEAGFKIGPGPGDGMKRGGTLATKYAAIDDFSHRDKERFKRSPERTPFRDPELTMTREEIIQSRYIL